MPTAPVEDDVTTPDARAPTDAAVPMDAGNPVEEMPAAPPPPPPDVMSPRDNGPPEPPPPLPTGGCLRFPTFNVRHTAMSPVQVRVSTTSTGDFVNVQTTGFQLTDRRVFFIAQAVGVRPSAEPITLGAAPNDNNATCTDCVGIYFNCALQPDGFYSCDSLALARAGQSRVESISSGPGTSFATSLWNVIFQEARVDPTTRVSTFVRNGACFTLDEMNTRASAVVVTSAPVDAGSATPDSGTGMERGSEQGLRQMSGAQTPGDLVSYHACTAGVSGCETGMTPACAQENGASQGTCISGCSQDSDCPSGGTCVYGVGSYYLRDPMRGYCFRPCMAGGCSVSGFGCATVQGARSENRSVCVPQEFITGDPTRACAPDPGGMFSPLYRVCGLNSGATYPCTPGARVTLGCNSGGAGAACGALGTCTGTPLLRVCPGDAPCGGWGALGHGVNNCGTCPVTTVVCPPSGRVRVYSASYDTSMPSTCVVQQR